MCFYLVGNTTSPVFPKSYTIPFLAEWKLAIIHGFLLIFYFLMLVPPLALVGRQIYLIRPFLKIGYVIMVEVFLVVCYKILSFPIEDPNPSNFIFAPLFLFALFFVLIGYMKLYQQWIHMIEDRVMQRRLAYFATLPVAAA